MLPAIGWKCVESFGRCAWPLVLITAPEWPSRALVTVLPTQSSTSPSQDRLLAYVDHALQHDDVFRTEFLANILHLDRPSTTGATNRTVRHLSRQQPPVAEVSTPSDDTIGAGTVSNR